MPQGNRALTVTLVVTSLACAFVLAATGVAQANRAFATRYSATERGSILLAGNSSLTCASSTSCTNARAGSGSSGNDEFTMTNVDVDSSSATFNSTRAQLTLPVGATVVFAGLYWGADTSAGTDGAAAPTPASNNRVRFTAPGASSATLTASVTDTDTASTTRYQGFVDVTSRVQSGGSGSYTVGNIQAGKGKNRYAGWGLVVAYRLASETLRRLVVYDGYVPMSASTTPSASVTLSDFVTPGTGTVRGRLGLLAYEGDRQLTGESATLENRALTDAANPTTNLFNSSRSRDGTAVATGDPTYANTLGMDVDDINVDGLLPNAASSATLRFGTALDEFRLGAFTLMTDEGPPTNRVVPATTGTTTEDQTLTADTGTWVGSSPIAYGYQWQRCNASGASCTNISGAASSTYALKAADVGSTVRVVVTASNAAGSTSASSTPTQVIAADPPETTISAGPSPTTTDSTPTFEFGADESGATFECRVDGGAWAACITPHTTAALADGQHTFDVRAVDAARAPDPTPASRTFTVDATAPQTTISSGPSGPTSSASPSFAFSSNEAGASFACRIDGGAWGPCASPQSFGPLADGQHTVEARATDTAGNVDATPAARTFTVDTRAPQTTVTAGPAGPSEDSTPTFSFASDETGGRFECRMDGGAFAACDSPFTPAALSDGAHTFDVRAVDAAGNADATPASLTVVVDTSPPDTTITTGPAGTTGDASPAFTFYGSETGASFQCRLDGGTFAACSSPHVASALAEGLHTLEVRALDAAGNVDPTPAARTFTVDTIAPDTTITSGPTGTTDDPTPAFEFSGGAGVTYECRVDDGAFAPCSSPYVTQTLADGSHTFQVRAIDAARNVDPTPATRTFTVQVVPPDPDAPETTINAAPPTATRNTTPTFQFSANETSTFQCAVDAGSFTSCSSPFTTAVLSEGQHTFQVRATDTAGNVDPTPEARTFTVDTTAPNTRIVASPAELTGDATPTFEFAGGDPGDRYECRVDGGTFADCDSPHTTATLVDGAHTLEVRAYDPAGNIDPTPASRTFTVDTDPPQTTLDGGPAGPTADNTPTFALAADEPGSQFECRVDSAAFAPCGATAEVDALADGGHTFEARAIDPAGNPDPTPVSRTFTVDTAAPQTTITAGPAGTTRESSPDFEFTAGEAGATFECRVDGGAFAPCSSPLSLSSLADGPHTLDVRATDRAGNTDPTPATRTFTVDADPPDTTITVGPGGPTADATPTFEMAADEPGSGFECRVDDGAFASCTSPFTTGRLEDGRHTLDVRAVDPAGNTDPSPASRTFTVDTDPPQTSITAGPFGPTGDATPEFEFTGDSPGTTFECRVDGGAFAACQSPHPAGDLADGEHTFEVRAIDPAGNADPTPATRTFTVDTDAPETTILSGPPPTTSDRAPSFGLGTDEDGATFECRVDGGAFSPCQSPTVMPQLADGAHTFEARAVDAAGNADATPAARTFTVDTEPPDTTITAGPSGPTADSTPAFELAADTPGTTFECRIDGGAYAACGSSFTAAELGDGPHTLEVRAVDSAGNADPTPATRSFTVDTDPPMTVMDGPAGPTSDTTPAFDLTADEGDVRFECRVDDGAFAACTTPFTTDALSDGEHRVQARAIDAAGNADPTPASRTIVVDGAAPDTTIESGPDGLTRDSAPSFTFGASEPGSTFECRVDGGAFAACPSPYVTEALDDGEHTMEVRATDAAGNADPSPASRRIVVDTTAPVTGITVGPTGTTDEPTPAFELSGGEGATFECRIDGSAFAPCSSPYVTDTLDDGEHTFEVRATDAAGNTDATPASRTFTVQVVPPDPNAPETTIDEAPPAITSDATPDFEFSANESATFECAVDGGAFTSCSSPFTASTLGDGQHSFQVRATDAAGNIDATPAARTFTVDTAPPDTRIDAAPPTRTGDPTATFEFAGGDPGDRYECRVDGGTFADCDSPHTTGTLADGAHTLEVRAYDPAGNRDPTPASHTFIVDTDQPQTTITSGPPAVTADASPGFALEADESGATFECRVDGGAFERCDASHTVASLAEGEHIFEARAVDGAGNVDPTPASRSFTVDTEPPQTSITEGPSGTTTDATPEFEFSDGTPDATFECRVDGGPFAPCASPHPTTTLADGEHTFEVRATDPAGNVDQTPASRTFTIDTDAPETTIDGGPAGPTTDSTPTFDLGADEPDASFECRVDGGAYAACDAPFTTERLADGEHTLEVRSTDRAGNSDATPASRTFTVDTDPPNTTITSGPAGQVADPAPTFEFSAAAGDRFECRVDDGPFASCSSPHTTAALDDGEHRFEVRAVDEAGNADPTPASRAFTVDTQPPQTTIHTELPSSINDATPTLELGASEAGASLECRVDGVAYAPCSSPHTLDPLADGLHVFEVRAVDRAGNVDSTPASRTFTVDMEPPDTAITSGPAGLTDDATPTFGFEAGEPGATLECRFDDGAFAPCSSPYTADPLGDGDHTLEIRAIDDAGNPDPTPATRTITVDTAAPQTTITSGPTGVTRDATSTFGLEADESGATLECRIDDGAFGACDPTHTTAALADGEHTIEARAVDAAGNADPTPAARTFTVDTDPPQTALVSGPAGTIDDPTPTFTFSADQAGSRFECRLDDGAWEACSSPHTTATLSDGAHTLDVRAIDPAGNPDPNPVRRAFAVSRVVPTPTPTPTPSPTPAPSTPVPPAATSPPTPPASSEGGAGGTACSDGRDNDGDGVADARDPGCLSSPSGGYAAGDGSEVDDLGELTGTQLALRCAGARLRLVDVRPASGDKVALRGAAQPRYAGKRVTLSLTSTRTKVATTTVAGDGSFNATVKAPRRSQRGSARYEAAIGSVRSRAVKLARRAAITSAAVRGGRVTLSGQIVRPLARPVAPVVITRQVGCGRSAAVARVRPRSNGSFRVTVPAPSGVRAAIFRVGTEVRRTASSRSVSNTFSLPMPVDLR